MATYIMWSAVCLVFFITTVSSKPIQPVSKDQEYSDVIRILKAIEKLLVYYSRNVRSLNLDGFFGLRVLEGHLLVILKEYKSGKHGSIPEYVWQQISQLAGIATKVGEEGLDFVRKDNPKYFDDFSPLVKNPWAFFKDQRQLDPDLRWEIPQYKAKLKAQLTEKLSDKCMKEVLDSSSNVCNVSELCLNTMTNRGLTGYSITHQLLWSILAESSPRCNMSIDSTLKSHSMESIYNMQLEMCTNNFYEMIAVVHVLMKGKIHESHQDLFLEQQFVCPSLGFYEFIKKDYLDQMLSWQYSSGCFGEKDTDNDDDVDMESLLETYHKRKNEKVQALQRVADNGKSLSGHRKIVANDQIHSQDQRISDKFRRTKISHTLLPAKRNKSQRISNEEKQSLHLGSSINVNHNPLVVANSNSHNRKLLVEKRLTGDCLSHKTGVASGALIVYLRYLIQPGKIKWSGPHELFEMDRKNMIQSNKKQQTDYLDNAVMNNDDDDDEDDIEDDDDVEEDDHDDEGNNGYEHVEDEREKKEIDDDQYYDSQNYQPEDEESKEDTVKHKSIQPIVFSNSPTRLASDQKQNLDLVKSKPGDNNDAENRLHVLYGIDEEERFRTSRPGALWYILILLSHILIIVFIVLKVFRHSRILKHWI